MRKPILRQRLTATKKPNNRASRIVRELIDLIDASGFTYFSVGMTAGLSDRAVTHLKAGTFQPTLRSIEPLGEVIGYHLEWRRK